MNFKKDGMGVGETLLVAIGALLLTFFLGAMIVWLVYGGFASKFGWPVLSYWEVLAAFIAIRLLVMK